MWIITKLTFKSDILKSFNKSILYKFNNIIKFFFFVIYIKMSQSLSAKYYQENKERLHKTWERYQNLSKEENHKLVEYRKKY